MVSRRVVAFFVAALVALAVGLPARSSAQAFAPVAAVLAEAYLVSASGKLSKFLPSVRALENPGIPSSTGHGLLAGILVLAPDGSVANKPPAKNITVTVTWPGEPGPNGEAVMASQKLTGKYDKSLGGAFVCGELNAGARGQNLTIRQTTKGGKNIPPGHFLGVGSGVVDTDQVQALLLQPFNAACKTFLVPAFANQLRANTEMQTLGFTR